MFRLPLLFLFVVLSPTLCGSMEPDADDINKLITMLQNPDANVRGKSIEQLERIGPEARAAIPALIAALDDTKSFPGKYFRTDVRTAAFRALHEIGLEATPALTRAIASEKPDFRRFPIDCLARFGPRARTALRSIEDVLSEPNQSDYYNALSALSRIDQQGSTAIPILERFVKPKGFPDSLPLHAHAAGLLGNYPDQPRVIPSLLSALKSSNAEIRGAAVQSLAQIPNSSDDIITGLIPLLHDTGETTKMCSYPGCATLISTKVSHLAANALAMRRTSGEKVIHELLKELETPPPEESSGSNANLVLSHIPKFRPVPARTAARVFQFYEQAVSKRQELMTRHQAFSEYDLTTELTAASCLTRLPAQTKELIPQLKSLFESTDEYQRFEAATILATIDPDRNQAAFEHVEAVIDLAGLEYGEIPPELAKRQAKMFPKGWDARLPEFAVRALLSNPALVEEFQSKFKEWSDKELIDWDDREFLELLKTLGPKMREIGPIILENHSDSTDLKSAFVALGPDMVPVLIANAKASLEAYQANPDADYWTSSTAMKLLPEFGEAALPACPVILDFAHSPNRHYRAAALDAMGKTLALHDRAFPELLKGLKDSRCIVRAAAASSLGIFTDRGDVIVPALAAALKDDYADVRAAALESLIKLSLDRPGIRDAVRLAQQDRHPYVKLLATEALEKAKP